MQNSLSNSDRFLVPLEGNFAEFPFFAPGADSCSVRRPTKIEVGVDDNRIVVIANGYGVPDALDADIFLILMYLSYKNGCQSKTYFSLRRIEDILGYHGSKRIKEAIKRLYHTTFQFIETFYNGSQYITLPDFKLIREAGFYDREKSEVPPKKAWKETYFVLDPIIIRNLKETKYFKFIDLKRHRKLHGGIAKRLHLYLAKKIGTKGIFKISFKKLARIIPLETYVKYKRKGDSLKILAKASRQFEELNWVKTSYNKEKSLFSFSKITRYKKLA